MSTSSDPSEAFSQLQKWLNSPAALPELMTIAKTVLSWAKSERVFLEIFGIKDGDSPSTMQKSVAGYVIEFLFKRPERLQRCRIELVDCLSSENTRKFRAIVTSRVIYYCLDQRRQMMTSPFHDIFRKMSSALSGHDDTRLVLRGDNESYYAVGSETDFPFLLEGKLSANDFKGWPDPGFPLAELRKAQVKVEIAKKFWNLAQQELDRIHLLPVLDLVRYLDATYNFSSIMTSESEFTEDYDGTASTESLHDRPNDFLGVLSAQQPVAEQKLQEADLERAALRLVQSWTTEMRQACYFHMARDLTLKETAVRMGLKSAQAASYHVVKVQNRLLEFFRLWRIEGYDGETPKHEEKIAVLRTVVNFILKNEPRCRDEE